MNSVPPSLWLHLLGWIRSIPRTALLSMVGPSILLFVSYFGWRYYGALQLDRTFYSLQKENIHIPQTPQWLKTPIVDEIYDGGGLSKLSLLDGQTAAVIARAFDAHPWIRKTHRVVKMAGKQVMVNVEFRTPIAMVCEVSTLPSNGNETTGYLPIDADGIVLPTKDFTSSDVPNFIHIYVNEFKSTDLKVGAPVGDTRIDEAVQLCRILVPYREVLKIDRVYVYPSKQVAKSKWILEVETKGGPRILWGRSPGLESLGEPTAETKLKQLIAIASDKNQWSQPKFDFTRVQ